SSASSTSRRPPATGGSDRRERGGAAHAPPRPTPGGPAPLRRGREHSSEFVRKRIPGAAPRGKEVQTMTTTQISAIVNELDKQRLSPHLETSADYPPVHRLRAFLEEAR